MFTILRSFFSEFLSVGAEAHFIYIMHLQGARCTHKSSCVITIMVTCITGGRCRIAIPDLNTANKNK